MRFSQLLAMVAPMALLTSAVPVPLTSGSAVDASIFNTQRIVELVKDFKFDTSSPAAVEIKEKREIGQGLGQPGRSSFSSPADAVRKWGRGKAKRQLGWGMGSPSYGQFNQLASFLAVLQWNNRGGGVPNSAMQHAKVKRQIGAGMGSPANNQWNQLAAFLAALRSMGGNGMSTNGPQSSAMQHA